LFSRDGQLQLIFFTYSFDMPKKEAEGDSDTVSPLLSQARLTEGRRFSSLIFSSLLPISARLRLQPIFHAASFVTCEPASREAFPRLPPVSSR